MSVFLVVCAVLAMTGFDEFAFGFDELLLTIFLI
jgi:hypothetical protein